MASHRFSFLACGSFSIGLIAFLACSSDMGAEDEDEPLQDAGAFDAIPDGKASDTSLVVTNDDGSTTNPGVNGLVQSKSATKPDALKLDVTLGAAAKTGNALIATVAGSIDPPTRITGGGLTTWTLQVKSDSHVPVSIWAGFGVSDAATATTVTLEWDRLQTSATVLVMEWSGISAAGSKVASTGLTKDMTISALDTAGARIVIATASMKDHAATIGTGMTSLETVKLKAVQLVSGYAAIDANSPAQLIPKWTAADDDPWDGVAVSFTP